MRGIEVTNDEISALVRTGFPQADPLRVEGDGHKVELTVVSADFEGQRSLQRQQRVYACLQQAIASGAIHAVSMRVLTPQEWQKISMFG